ncbi:Mucolipidin and related proteins (TRML subfamily of transient receptor potential proteins) [Plasmopara halstedii]|uniref:Mucolipidin and related proteins (TRML subfamily of transient receptor potential proteins) n=1 Tax=Plasmopara halstedii TaxID=4781 RepID=A0A0P1B0J3_PLAHL|nr:Mucolipidin and related proteins (TRML subfamily of transient receptor potential proteins) [Plasmopara halstedii]CEG47548.1 Mucolipidin and related proteins (TRML subfamily of transient receptor potential proteins) [Plasmopara halstedii]|eukprot:XP_024583917.1 Mucolipidin and related proteins (TRML subfamily of transient receptor potential proteins) [Plasmopara halstedii]
MEPHLEAELRRGLLEAAPYEDSPKRDKVSTSVRLLLSLRKTWAARGHFPYKLALHVTLVLLTFTQMQLYDAQNTAYLRASHRNWAFFFLPPSATIGIIPRYQRELYTIEHTLTALLFLRDAYFTIGNTSVASYEYLRLSSGDIQPIRLAVVQMLPNGNLVKREYLVYQDDKSVGPFDPTLPWGQKINLFRSLRSVRFSFSLRDHQFGTHYLECFEWQVNVRFEVIESAQIRVQLEDSEVFSCSNSYSRPFWTATRQSFVWMHITIAVVSSLYMVLSLKYLWRCFNAKPNEDDNMPFKHGMDDVLHNNTTEIENRDRSQQYFRQYNNPSYWRFRQINSFQLIVLVSLVLLLCSTTWSLFLREAHIPIRFWHRLLHATALLLLWSSSMGYLQHNQNIFSIVLTLKLGLPRVLQFLLGVFPLFFGYALFGTIYFGNKIEEFGCLSASMVTLFSLMNGDAILDTFDAMKLHNFSISGKVYMYSFISLFTYVVLNIFIAIVEEAFFATQSSRRRLNDLLSDRHVLKT